MALLLAAARPSGRLRPRVVGWPVGRVRRLRRVWRVGVVSPCRSCCPS
ncbi:MAG: hypothetical protein ACK587_02610 [Cyanobacteriota bacterium]